MNPEPEQEPERRQAAPPAHIGLVIAALVLAVAGWGGMFYVVINTPANPPSRRDLWLVFACLFAASSGTALPFVRFLNARFSRGGAGAVSAGGLLRQSILVALFVTGCAWMELTDILSAATAALLALALIVVEVFLRWLESAQYQP